MNAYLEQWRHEQHDSTQTAADIRMTIWLAGLDREQVVLEQAELMQPAEIALMRRPGLSVWGAA